MCITCVYICNTGVWITCVIHLKHKTCITSVSPISAHGLWEWLMILTLFAKLTYVNVLHWIVGLYYYGFLVNKGIYLILVIQTLYPSTLSVLYNKDVFQTSSIVWFTIFPFTILKSHYTIQNTIILCLLLFICLNTILISTQVLGSWYKLLVVSHFIVVQDWYLLSPQITLVWLIYHVILQNIWLSYGILIMVWLIFRILLFVLSYDFNSDMLNYLTRAWLVISVDIGNSLTDKL